MTEREYIATHQKCDIFIRNILVGVVFLYISKTLLHCKFYGPTVVFALPHIRIAARITEY